MRQRKNILERVVHGTELDAQPMLKRPLVELVDTGRLLIENHFGVTEYGDEKIHVKVRFGQICIYGHGLELAMMSKERLIITGCIECIRLFRGGEEWGCSSR